MTTLLNVKGLMIPIKNQRCQIKKNTKVIPNYMLPVTMYVKYKYTINLNECLCFPTPETMTYVYSHQDNYMITMVYTKHVQMVPEDFFQQMKGM